MVCLAKESETTLKGIKDSTRHFLLEMPPSSARRAKAPSPRELSAQPTERVALPEGAVGACRPRESPSPRD